MNGKEIRAVFGQNIRIFRNRRNWSQADLAESAEISINFLSDIERGKKWPHPDTLSRLAGALGINVFELFKEDNMSVSLNKQDLMHRFVKDVSLAVKKSISLNVNQSIKTVLKQYNLKTQ